MKKVHWLEVAFGGEGTGWVIKRISGTTAPGIVGAVWVFGVSSKKKATALRNLIEEMLK